MQVHVQKVYGTLAATTAVASVGSVLGMGLMVRSTALSADRTCACLCAYWLVRTRAPACAPALVVARSPALVSVSHAWGLAVLLGLPLHLLVHVCSHAVPANLMRCGAHWSSRMIQSHSPFSALGA